MLVLLINEYANSILTQEEQDITLEPVGTYTKEGSTLSNLEYEIPLTIVVQGVKKRMDTLTYTPTEKYPPVCWF